MGRVLSTPELRHRLATCLWCVFMFRIVPDKIPHNQTDTLADLNSLQIKAPQHDCVIVLGDFNAKLPRNSGKQTGRWCIHSRSNTAGDMLMNLLKI